MCPLTYSRLSYKLVVTSKGLLDRSNFLEMNFHKCVVYSYITSEGTYLVVQLLVIIHQGAQPDPYI